MAYGYGYPNFSLFELHATSFEASVKSSTLDILQVQVGSSRPGSAEVTNGRRPSGRRPFVVAEPRRQRTQMTPTPPRCGAMLTFRTPVFQVRAPVRKPSVATIWPAAAASAAA